MNGDNDMYTPRKRKCGKGEEITLYIYMYVEITTYVGGAASDFCFIPTHVFNSLEHLCSETFL